MKRPLMLWCLFFLVILRLVLTFVSSPEYPLKDRSGEYACVYGKISAKEEKGTDNIVYMDKAVYVPRGSAKGEEENTEEESPRWQAGIVGVIPEGEAAPPVGARVKMIGKVWVYPAATNPGEFDLQEYYYCKGYSARLSVEDWEFTGEGYSLWREGLYRLRVYLAGVYDRILPEESAAVMKAVVLGLKSEVSAELKDLYRVNGIAHILAISGLHISILGMGLYKGLRRLGLPLVFSFPVALFFLVNYAMLVGAGTSTVRALIMFGLMAFAEVERRAYDLPTALLVSAASTAFFSPRELLQSGFWLSYLAVFGIAVYYPAVCEGFKELMDPSFRKKPAKRLARKAGQALGGSLAVSAFTLPVILYTYFETPVYGAFLNLLIIPLMSILMVCGVASLGLGALCLVFLPGNIPAVPPGMAAIQVPVWAAQIHPLLGLASVVAWPCHLILRLYSLLCEWVEGIPFHTFITGQPKLLQLLLSYAFFLAVLLTGRRMLARVWTSGRPAAVQLRKICHIPEYGGKPGQAWKRFNIRKLLGIRLGLSAMGVFICLLCFKPDLVLTFLDVGQGDGICLDGKNGAYIIDGGSTSVTDLYRYRLGPFLKHEGILDVEAWFITHPDRDHTSALLEMLEKGDGRSERIDGIRIKCIVLPDAEGVREDCLEILELAGKNGIPVAYFSAGEVLEDGYMEILCLHPQKGFETEDVNAYSQILQVSAPGFRGLFSGDATAESEKLAMEKAEEWERCIEESGTVSTEGGQTVSVKGMQTMNRGTFGCADLIKVGHHGSSTSTSDEWLSFASPQLAVISCGYHNSYGHPHEEVVKKLEEAGVHIFRTDRDGAVIVIPGEKGIAVETFGVKSHPLEEQ